MVAAKVRDSEATERSAESRNVSALVSHPHFRQSFPAISKTCL